MEKCNYGFVSLLINSQKFIRFFCNSFPHHHSTRLTHNFLVNANEFTLHKHRIWKTWNRIFICINFKSTNDNLIIVVNRIDNYSYTFMQWKRVFFCIFLMLFLYVHTPPLFLRFEHRRRILNQIKSNQSISYSSLTRFIFHSP